METQRIITYHTWDNFCWGKIGKFDESWVIHQKFSSPISTDTPKMYFGICTDCSLFTKLFLTNSFYLYGLPKFSPTKYFPCTYSTQTQLNMYTSCIAGISEEKNLFTHVLVNKFSRMSYLLCSFYLGYQKFEDRAKLVNFCPMKIPCYTVNTSVHDPAITEHTRKS